MKVSKILNIGILGVSLGAGSALGATYNFEQLVDFGIGAAGGTIGAGTTYGDTTSGSGYTGGTGGGPLGAGQHGEAAFDVLEWTKDGVTLTATGTESGGHAHAYLDKGQAGLGVCADVWAGSNQCNPNYDDNVQTGEVLKLSFSEEVTILLVDTLFRDSNHNEYTGIPLGLTLVVDGVGVAGGPSATGEYTGSIFEFSTSNDVGQFYISSLATTPLPGAALLFGSAILGIAGFNSRKRRA